MSLREGRRSKVETMQRTTAVARRFAIYNDCATAHDEKTMGDRSPKANQKKSSQKQSKANSANQKKGQAIAAKQAAGQASKKKK
jgi:hypothetical protein